MKNLLTIDEISVTLRKPKGWIYRRTMQKGEDTIPHIKLGKQLLFIEEDVERWVMGHAVGGKE